MYISTVSSITHYPYYPLLGDLQKCFQCFRYQCFHSVNLTLHTASSIHSNSQQEYDTTRNSETRWKLPIDSRPKRERNQVGKGKSPTKKNKNSVSRKKLLMFHLKVILILLLKNISAEILHAVVVNEWWSITNFFSNCRTNWSYSSSSFIRSIKADWLSDEQSPRTPKETIFLRKKDSIK